MFVKIPLLRYSDFLTDTLLASNPDFQKYFKNKSDKSVGEIVGAYGGLNIEFDTNPLYVKEKGQSYSNLRFKKKGIYSNLRRKKRLEGSVFEDWVFRNNGESDEDLQIRRKEAEKHFLLKPYGTADSVEQIFKAFSFLDDIKDRNFIISMHLIVKDDEPNTGGFRQHKNGPYIGTKKMEHEYFAHEGSQFKELVSYKISEVEFVCEHEVIELHHFKFLVKENTDRHTYIMIFNKKDELLAHAWKDDDGEIVVGHTYKELFKVSKKETMLLTIEAKLLEFVNETI